MDELPLSELIHVQILETRVKLLNLEDLRTFSVDLYQQNLRKQNIIIQMFEDSSFQTDLTLFQQLAIKKTQIRLDNADYSEVFEFCRELLIQDAKQKISFKEKIGRSLSLDGWMATED